MHQAVNGGFCSHTCYGAFLATKILNTLDHDHRYCLNCFRKLKTVYPPGRSLRSSEVYADSPDDNGATMTDIPDFVIGRAYPRPETQDAHEAEVLRPRDPVAGDWTHEPVDGVARSRAVCECGVMHHRSRFPAIRARRLTEYASHLSTAVRKLLHEDEHDHTHDPAVLEQELADAYLDLNAEWQRRQIARALGQAILATE